MNFVALVLAAAVTTAQLGSLRDSSTVVTGVDAGAFLSSSNNVVAAGKTNELFSGAGVVKATGVGLVVDGGGLTLRGGATLSAEGAAYFRTNRMSNASAAGWESLDQRMERKLGGAFYYDTDLNGEPTAITLGSRYLPLVYPVGPYSVVVNGGVASGVGAVAFGPSRATAYGAFAHGAQSRASADGAVAMGSHAEATNQYSFVWQGYAGGIVPFGGSAYGSHGDGTFSIYPRGGVDGFWIGPSTLGQYMSEKVAGLVDPAYPFTFRSALGDSGIQFSSSGGHNREVFTAGTSLEMQEGSSVSVASNATLSVADPAGLTVGGVGIGAWVADAAGRAAADGARAAVDSETGGTNGVKVAADFARLNAVRWVGVGLADGIVLRKDALRGAWTDGAQSMWWTGSVWKYETNGVESAADGTLASVYVKFAARSTASSDFAFRAEADADGFLKASDTNALAAALSPLLDVDAVPDNAVVFTNGALRTKSGAGVPGEPGNTVVYTNGALRTKSGADVDLQGMDYEAMTTTVNRVKAKFWDAPLEVEWTFKAVNGEFMMIATTNVNTGVLSP